MPPPEFGATAWGRAWVRTIERTTGVPNPNLPKARSLARNLKVTLTIEAGTVAAAVVDGAAQHTVSIPLLPWSDNERATAERVLEAAPGQSIVGDLPDSLLPTLEQAGVALAVPMSDIAGACSCRTRTKPCAHVLATLYALVLLVDERPVTAVEVRADGRISSTSEAPGWVPMAAVEPHQFYVSARVPQARGGA